MAPAVETSFTPGFGVNIAGQGSQQVGSVQVASSYGTVSYATITQNIYVYERIPWPEFEYILYQGLAVRADSWLVMWFYCQEDQLKWVYYETTHGDALQVEAATGSCQDTTAQAISVSMPETNMTPPPPQTSHELDGDSIHYADGDGWLLHNNTNWTFIPFQTIDCTTECGDSGWYELHIVMWNETRQEAAFGILYLRSWTPQEVTLEYGLMLPTLERFGTTFAATWST